MRLQAPNWNKPRHSYSQLPYIRVGRKEGRPGHAWHVPRRLGSSHKQGNMQQWRVVDGHGVEHDVMRWYCWRVERRLPGIATMFMQIVVCWNGALSYEKKFKQNFLVQIWSSNDWNFLEVCKLSFFDRLRTPKDIGRHSVTKITNIHRFYFLFELCILW